MRMTNLCHHWWCAIKRKFWPCDHRVKLLAGGIIMDQTLLVSSTHTGNVYRCTIRCRRCQIVVMRFEGQIEERGPLIIIDENEAFDEEKMRKFEGLPVIVAPPGVNIWSGPKGRNWMADFTKKGKTANE